MNHPFISKPCLEVILQSGVHAMSEHPPPPPLTKTSPQSPIRTRSKRRLTDEMFPSQTFKKAKENLESRVLDTPSDDTPKTPVLKEARINPLSSQLEAQGLIPSLNLRASLLPWAPNSSSSALFHQSHDPQTKDLVMPKVMMGLPEIPMGPDIPQTSRPSPLSKQKLISTDSPSESILSEMNADSRQLWKSVADARISRQSTRKNVLNSQEDSKEDQKDAQHEADSSNTDMGTPLVSKRSVGKDLVLNQPQSFSEDYHGNLELLKSKSVNQEKSLSDNCTEPEVSSDFKNSIITQANPAVALWMHAVKSAEKEKGKAGKSKAAAENASRRNNDVRADVVKASKEKKESLRPRKPVSLEEKLEIEQAESMIANKKERDKNTVKEKEKNSEKSKEKGKDGEKDKEKEKQKSKEENEKMKDKQLQDGLVALASQIVAQKRSRRPYFMEEEVNEVLEVRTFSRRSSQRDTVMSDWAQMSWKTPILKIGDLILPSRDVKICVSRSASRILRVDFFSALGFDSSSQFSQFGNELIPPCFQDQDLYIVPGLNLPCSTLTAYAVAAYALRCSSRPDPLDLETTTHYFDAFDDLIKLMGEQPSKVWNCIYQLGTAAILETTYHPNSVVQKKMALFDRVARPTPEEEIGAFESLYLPFDDFCENCHRPERGTELLLCDGLIVNREKLNGKPCPNVTHFGPQGCRDPPLDSTEIRTLMVYPDRPFFCRDCQIRQRESAQFLNKPAAIGQDPQSVSFLRKKRVMALIDYFILYEGGWMYYSADEESSALDLKEIIMKVLTNKYHWTNFLGEFERDVQTMLKNWNSVPPTSQLAIRASNLFSRHLKEFSQDLSLNSFVHSAAADIHAFLFDSNYLVPDESAYMPFKFFLYSYRRFCARNNKSALSQHELMKLLESWELRCLRLIDFSQEPTLREYPLDLPPGLRQFCKDIWVEGYDIRSDLLFTEKQS